MKAVPLLVVLLLLAWAPLRAEPVIVYQEAAQLHAQPKADSRVVGLVFGGETLPVMEARENWFKVRSGKNVEGWLSSDFADVAQHVAAPADDPRAKLLLTANQHQDLARIPEARMAYAEVVLRYPGTYEAYVATRNLLKYHQVATLPPAQHGHISASQNEQGRRIGGQALGEEARMLLREGRVKLAGQVLAGIGNVAGAQMAALDGLEVVTTDYVKMVADKLSPAELTAAVAMYRSYFPQGKLPDNIERRVPREATAAPSGAPAASGATAPASGTPTTR